jgi:hypothetical protein
VFCLRLPFRRAYTGQLPVPRAGSETDGAVYVDRATGGFVQATPDQYVLRVHGFACAPVARLRRWDCDEQTDGAGWPNPTLRRYK